MAPARGMGLRNPPARQPALAGHASSRTRAIPFATTLPTQLRIATINCGSSGLLGAHDRIVTAYNAAMFDILLLNETHVAPGDGALLHDFTVLTSFRAAAIRSHSVHGGVAVAISKLRACVAHAEIFEACSGADVLAVSVTIAGCARKLIVVSVYFPPANGSVCTSVECAAACAKSHVNIGLHFIRDVALRAAATSDVYVGGDFNARAPASSSDPRSARFADVCDIMLEAGVLFLSGPRDASTGFLLPTRFDPSGSSSILDLVLTGDSNAYSHSCVLETVRVVSDHAVLLSTLELLSAAAADLPELACPPSFGYAHRLPSHLVTAFVRKPVTPAAATLFVHQLQARAGADLLISSDLASNASYVLHSAARQTELLQSANKLYHDRTSQPQRAALRAMTRAKRSGVGLTEATVQLRALRPARKIEQRARRKLKRQCARISVNRTCAGVPNDSVLQPDFKHTAPRFLVALSYHSRRTQLYALFVGLKTKYRSSEGDVAALEAQCAHLPVFTGPVNSAPQLAEVNAAVQRINTSAAVLGCPMNVFKAAWSCAPFAAMVVTAIQRAWCVGIVPAEWCISRAVLIYKHGPVSSLQSYRVIMITSALAKVMLAVLNARLCAHVSPFLAASQLGFRSGHGGALAAAFVLRSAVFTRAAAGLEADVLLADINGAFPHTERAHVLQELVDMHTEPALVRLLTHFHVHQQFFVQNGKLVSPSCRTSLGLFEGHAVSPIEYLVSTNRASLALAASAPAVGVPLLNEAALHHVTLADDIAVVSPSLPALQQQARCLEREYTLGAPCLAHTLSFGTGKTAMLHFARHRRDAITPGTLIEMSPTLAVPVVAVYKHLGLQLAGAGAVASIAAQQKVVQVQAGTVIARVARSSVKRSPFATGLHLYLTSLRPAATYGAGLIWMKPPAALMHAEACALKIIFGRTDISTVALRAAAGMCSMHTQLDIWVMQLFLTLLACDSGSLPRVQLTSDFVAATSCAPNKNKGLLWPSIQARLLILDQVYGVCPRLQASLQHCPPSWQAWGRLLVTQPHTAPLERSRIDWCMRQLLAAAEAARRRAELRQRVSLLEVDCVLDAPNRWPLCWCFPSDARALRCKILGGVRCVFDHQYFHTACCPWCGEVGGFTMQHLLARCGNFEGRRIAVLERVRDEGIRLGVCRAHDVHARMSEWFAFLIGAGVMP